MAITPVTAALMRDVLENIKVAPLQSRRVLSLGYPDLIMDRRLFARLFGEEAAAQAIVHPDSDSIIRWHGCQAITSEILESVHAFSLLGYELDIVDISQSRGTERILDLNYPAPADLDDRYALVLDGGTVEHVFNAAQAMFNIARWVTVGGYVIQSNPINYPNHGFYSLSPTFYFDFYESNGFEMQFFAVNANPAGEPHLIEVSPHTPIRDPIPPRSANILVALKREAREPIYPMQAKYRSNPNLKG